MSIEKNLERIADAVESIASSLEKVVATVEFKYTVEVPEEKLELPPMTTAPPPPPPNMEAPPSCPPPEEPAAALTREELNTALVEESKRVGDPQKIFAIIKAEPFNATGIDTIDPGQYQALLNAVKALQP